eukprot:300133_1
MQSTCLRIFVMTLHWLQAYRQQIRIKDDKNYKTISPHVTILYPFVNPIHFENMIKYLQNVINTNNIQQFELSLPSFDVFDHVSKQEYKFEKEYMFLKPSLQSSIKLKNIFNCINKDNVFHKSRIWPSYTPHLTIGQYKCDQILKKKDELNTMWKQNNVNIKFICDRIYMLSRKSKNDKFEVRYEINLQ